MSPGPTRARAAVILAAGQGTRMKSPLPKVLHPVGGRPILGAILEAASALAPERTIVVVGPRQSEVAAFAAAKGAIPALQDPPHGTGHAAQCALPALEGFKGDVLILYGDTPLLTAATLERLVAAHEREGATITLLTTRIADPALRPNGRVVRSADGRVEAVVELAEATPAQRNIDECNMGIYAFDAAWLWPALARVEPSAVKGEIYLTSLIGMAIAEGRGVDAVTTEDYSETLGVDTRALLAEAEAVMQRRLAHHWMAEGVTLRDPSATYIDVGVAIGPDTTLLPGTHLLGRTRVGAGCVIGPNSIVRDAVVGDGCRIEMAVVEGVGVPAGMAVGPFAHLHPGQAGDSYAV